MCRGSLENARRIVSSIRKIKDRRAFVVAARWPCVPAGVRLIVVSNRLYSGILIRSQLTELAVVYGTSKTSIGYCERTRGFKRRGTGQRVSIYAGNSRGSSRGGPRHLRRRGGRKHARGFERVTTISLPIWLPAVPTAPKWNNRFDGR